MGEVILRPLDSFGNIGRLKKFLEDPVAHKDLIREGEFIPGVYMTCTERLYPQSPAIQKLLISYLISIGYLVETIERTINPRDPAVWGLEATPSSELVKYGVECGKCQAFIQTQGEPADMQKCPECNAVLKEKFPSKGLAYPIMKQTASSMPTTLEEDMMSMILRDWSKADEKEYEFTARLETPDGSLEEINLKFTGKELPVKTDPTLGLVIDHYDRETGLVYLHADRASVKDEDIKALAWNSSTAEKSYRVLADKVHGRRIILPVESFRLYYTATNYREVKQFAGKVYRKDAELPLGESIAIHQSWSWDLKALRSHETWCLMVGMTPNIGFYRTDHPFEFSKDKIEIIENFLQIFLGIDPSKVRAAIAGDFRAPNVIRALAKISGEPLIMNPNRFIVHSGTQIRLRGETPSSEQILQEMHYFREEFGKAITLADFLSALGIDLNEHIYDNKVDRNGMDYQALWDQLDLDEGNHSDVES